MRRCATCLPNLTKKRRRRIRRSFRVRRKLFRLVRAFWKAVLRASLVHPVKFCPVRLLKFKARRVPPMLLFPVRRKFPQRIPWIKRLSLLRIRPLRPIPRVWSRRILHEMPQILSPCRVPLRVLRNLPVRLFPRRRSLRLPHLRPRFPVGIFSGRSRFRKSMESTR